MNRIAELRKERNLTQKEFGEIMGVAQNTICNWENGRREPDYEALKKMAFFFDCSVDYLLGTASFGRYFVFSDDAQSEKDLDWAGRPQTVVERKEKPISGDGGGLNAERKQLTLEESNRLLVAMGFIEEGQDLSDDDLAFLTHIIGLLGNRFSKRGHGEEKNRPEGE